MSHIKSSISAITISVFSDNDRDGELHFGAFTPKKDSPFYDEGKESKLLDNCEKLDLLEPLIKKETGIDLLTWDLYYGFSFEVEITSLDEVASIQAKLTTFCQKYFDCY